MEPDEIITWDSLQSTQLSCLTGGMYFTPICSRKDWKMYFLMWNLHFYKLCKNIFFCFSMAPNSLKNNFQSCHPRNVCTRFGTKWKRFWCRWRWRGGGGGSTYWKPTLERNPPAQFKGSKLAQMSPGLEIMKRWRRWLRRFITSSFL